MIELPIKPFIFIWTSIILRDQSYRQFIAHTTICTIAKSQCTTLKCGKTLQKRPIREFLMHFCKIHISDLQVCNSIGQKSLALLQYPPRSTGSGSKQKTEIRIKGSTLAHLGAQSFDVNRECNELKKPTENWKWRAEPVQGTLIATYS